LGEVPTEGTTPKKEKPEPLKVEKVVEKAPKEEPVKKEFPKLESSPAKPKPKPVDIPPPVVGQRVERAV
jgi:hypothetical protein